MKMNLKGVGVALVTPFDQFQNVDYQALERLLQHTAQAVEYWVVHGTTAESATTNAAEKAEILDFIKKHNPKKKPLVYGLGGNNTEEILAQFKKVNWEGISAILSVVPYYNKPTQEGLYQHFRTIADAAPLPIILYNVPSRTVTNLKAETVLRLAEHPNIIGIKEASGDFEQCIQILKHKPAHFDLVSGDDLLTVSLVAVGAVGVISVLANALPVEFGSMVHAALQNDYAKAQEILYKLFTINNLMYQEGNPVGVKQALELRQITSSEVRLPLVKASANLKEAIKKALI